MCELLVPQVPTNFFQTLHPSISAWNTHGLPRITSPSNMSTVLIRRSALTDSCRNLTALLPRCTKTSFLLTPLYICAHRNSENLHNAAFIGYSLVGEWRTCTVLWSYIYTHLLNLKGHVYVGVVGEVEGRGRGGGRQWPHGLQPVSTVSNKQTKPGQNSTWSTVATRTSAITVISVI